MVYSTQSYFTLFSELYYFWNVHSKIHDHAVEKNKERH